MVLKITQLLRFFMHLQMTKRYEKKNIYIYIYIHTHTIQYAILIILIQKNSHVVEI